MSFYLRRGADEYEPTKSTESPWDTRAQHGGPPTALLAHAMAPGGDLRLARISVDFLGPIPRQPFRIEVSPLKPGRLTFLQEARMIVDGRVVVTARGWHLATGPEPAVVTEARLPPPRPATPSEHGLFTGLESWGYGEAIEWRFTNGGFGKTGPTDVWTRVKPALIDGEEITGQARTLLIADSANGLSAVLPLAEWLSIPPTMTTTLLRPAGGEWVHMSCRTENAPDGIGIAHAELFDDAGFLGQVAQPLLVRRR
jgi:Acyl-CoA thioesterase C-terminal domain/Acyl-CoA thioesterase N-terminal domain